MKILTLIIITVFCLNLASCSDKYIDYRTVYFKQCYLSNNGMDCEAVQERNYKISLLTNTIVIKLDNGIILNNDNCIIYDFDNWSCPIGISNYQNSMIGVDHFGLKEGNYYEFRESDKNYNIIQVNSLGYKIRTLFGNFFSSLKQLKFW